MSKQFFWRPLAVFAVLLLGVLAGTIAIKATFPPTIPPSPANVMKPKETPNPDHILAEDTRLVPPGIPTAEWIKSGKQWAVYQAIRRETDGSFSHRFLLVYLGDKQAEQPIIRVQFPTMQDSSGSVSWSEFNGGYVKADRVFVDGWLPMQGKEAGIVTRTLLFKVLQNSTVSIDWSQNGQRYTESLK